MPKVKRIMIGDTKVRPYRFEYSYDFTNGSTAQMQADGWTGYSGASFNENGIYYDGWKEYRVQPSGLSTVVSTANEIYLDITYYKNGTGRRCDYCNSLATGSSGYANQTGIYGNRNIICVMAGGTDLNNGGTATIANGWYTITMVVDIKNKKIDYNFPGIKNQTYTITDSEITNMKLCDTILVLQNSNSYIKSINVKIK